jgi:hypothetical protein
MWRRRSCTAAAVAGHSARPLRLGALAGGMAAGDAFIGGMDIAVGLYLARAFRLMTNCDVNRVKRSAAHRDERHITIPPLVVASALASLLAMAELEDTTPSPRSGGRDDPAVLTFHAYNFRAAGQTLPR